MPHLAAWYEELLELAPRLDLAVKELGQVEGNPILFLHPKYRVTGPDLLFMSGFHGDEQAGPWGLLEYLKDGALGLKWANISFLPMMNPVGTMMSNRFNQEGANPNRGWDLEHQWDRLSAEGRLVAPIYRNLVAAGKDGVLSLHEDPNQDGFYFLFVHEDTIHHVALVMRDVGNRWFGKPSDGIHDGLPVTNGYVHFHRKDTLEESLSHDGVHRVITSETPTRAHWEARVACNAELIRSFTLLSLNPEARVALRATHGL
jgi:hypothetical protein